jgi:ribosomal protein S15P/S13E
MQAAVFCEKVISQVNHLRDNHKDITGVIRLIDLINRRKRAMEYLRKVNYADYVQIMKIFQGTVEDNFGGMHKSNFRLRRRRDH